MRKNIVKLTLVLDNGWSKRVKRTVHKYKSADKFLWDCNQNWFAFFVSAPIAFFGNHYRRHLVKFITDETTYFPIKKIIICNLLRATPARISSFYTQCVLHIDIVNSSSIHFFRVNSEFRKVRHMLSSETLHSLITEYVKSYCWQNHISFGLTMDLFVIASNSGSNMSDGIRWSCVSTQTFCTIASLLIPALWISVYGLLCKWNETDIWAKKMTSNRIKMNRNSIEIEYLDVLVFYLKFL